MNLRNAYKRQTKDRQTNNNNNKKKRTLFDTTLRQVCFTFSFTYPLYKHTDKHTHTKKLSNSLDLFFPPFLHGKTVSYIRESQTSAHTHAFDTTRSGVIVNIYIFVLIGCRRTRGRSANCQNVQSFSVHKTVRTFPACLLRVSGVKHTHTQKKRVCRRRENN